jgi:Phage tail lysozyme
MFEQKAPWLINQLSRDLGLQPYQAAGVVGHLGHESAGLQAINERNPLIKGSRGGFGWAQWTGPRRRQFERWAAETGLDPASDQANYGFLLREMTTGPEAKVVAALRQAPDAYTAGRVFTNKFLRPGIPGYASRDKWTARALASVDPNAVMQPLPADREQLAKMRSDPLNPVSGRVTYSPPGAPTGTDYLNPISGRQTYTPPEAAAPQQGPPMPPKKKGKAKTWRDLFKGAGEGFVAGLGGGAALPVAQAAAPIPTMMAQAPTVAPIDPATAEINRQRMAQALARLNTGQLFG